MSEEVTQSEQESRFLTVKEVKQEPSNKPFAGVYLLKKAELKTARNGSGFFLIELGDRTGSFHSTCFEDSPLYRELEAVTEGAVVRIQGRTDYYQSRLSPRIGVLEILDETEASQYLNYLVEVSPEDPDALWEALQESIARIAHPVLRATVTQVFQDSETAFRNSHAAIGMHHAYRHGLLEHTVHVVRACCALLPLYLEVCPDLALAGALLHDVGKVLEYQQETVAARRTRNGVLEGHVVLGFRLVRKAALQSKLDAELTERLEHIILSHQGELEWGAAVMAATPEAVFISMVDNLDAKMGMVQQALRNTPPSSEFSDYLPGLKTALLTTPVPLSPDAT